MAAMVEICCVMLGFFGFLDLDLFRILSATALFLFGLMSVSFRSEISMTSESSSRLIG